MRSSCAGDGRARRSPVRARRARGRARRSWAVALVVEAALPYTLFGLAYVATLGANSGATVLFMSVYVMLTGRRFPHMWVAEDSGAD